MIDVGNMKPVILLPMKIKLKLIIDYFNDC